MSDNFVPTLDTQETERPEPAPDMNPPPDTELDDIDSEERGVGEDGGAPPFTGEDVEDAGKPRDPRSMKSPEC